MHNHNNEQESFNTDTPSQSDMAGKDRGPQGIDKAPGEETAQNLENVAQETQKGKKVDADLTQESDHPVDQPKR